jgi:hypothetical protein
MLGSQRIPVHKCSEMLNGVWSAGCSSSHLDENGTDWGRKTPGTRAGSVRTNRIETPGYTSSLSGRNELNWEEPPGTRVCLARKSRLWRSAGTEDGRPSWNVQICTQRYECNGTRFRTIMNCHPNAGFRYEMKLYHIGVSIKGAISHSDATSKSIWNVNFLRCS